MKTILFLLIAVPVVIFSGCKKQSPAPAANNGPAIQTAGPLEFILETTDMNGNFKSQFSQGENFNLKLLIKNNSTQNITLCHCFLTEYPELLTVYSTKKITLVTKYGQQIVEPNDSVGRPWKGAGGMDIAPITYAFPQTTIQYSLPWSAPDTTVHYWAPYPIQYQGFDAIQNDPLPLGEYYTKFNFVYAGKNVNLKYYFQIH